MRNFNNHITVRITCEKCGNVRYSDFHKSNLTKRERQTHEMYNVCHVCAKANCNMKG